MSIKDSFKSVFLSLIMPGRFTLYVYGVIMLTICLLLLQPATMVIFRLVTDVYSLVGYHGYGVVWVLILCAVIAWELLSMVSRFVCGKLARFANWLVLYLI